MIEHRGIKMRRIRIEGYDLELGILREEEGRCILRYNIDGEHCMVESMGDYLEGELREGICFPSRAWRVTSYEPESGIVRGVEVTDPTILEEIGSRDSLEDCMNP